METATVYGQHQAIGIAEIMGKANDTPMMRQYLQIKAQVPDALLLYRMGDFYELFYEDAEEAAGILELTLTSRNRNDPNPIPMAGIPYHALNGYLKRLVNAGRKVALAEQRAPAEGSGRKLMERELVRVVTPGIPWDSDAIAAREPCYLAGIWGNGPVGLAFLDSSTGQLCLTEVAELSQACAEILRMEPKEVVIDPNLSGHLETALLPLDHLPVSTSSCAHNGLHEGKVAIQNLLGRQDLMGAGVGAMGPALCAANDVIHYATEVARINLDHVKSVHPYQAGNWVVLDEATRRNLEVFRPHRGEGRKGSLVHLMDRSKTAMGGRLLRQWLHRPLVDLVEIRTRQNGIESLLDNEIRQPLREALAGVADMERLSAKVGQGTANARDLWALASSLDRLPELNQILEPIDALKPWMPADLCADIAAEIFAWLVDDPPLAITEGGLIRQGNHEDLDELISLSHNGKQAIAQMEAREREITGITSLKIKYNRVFGYFLEVTQANKDRVPQAWIRKQTLVNAERFITPELKEFEDKILGAEERRKALELSLFRELRARIALSTERIQSIAGHIAVLDVLSGLADLAVDRRYCRPTVNEGLDLDIQQGRHPVVEAMDLGEDFVPNDLSMDVESRVIILTGPNMAGKSTLMRQAALIVLMAQIGSFVPAASAQIGLVDRILVRVGASDDLARGRSTFMVEMGETAFILNAATPRSLIILDEIGRGTSTYDGLAIAWSVAEAIHDQIHARTIFATHYHELSQLADERAAMCNMHVAVREWQDEIVFLRSLRAGGASRSYGIQCARLAGIPTSIVERSKTLLNTLETQRALHNGPQLSLFSKPPTESDESPQPGPTLTALMNLNPDSMTPREALEALYNLQDLGQTE